MQFDGSDALFGFSGSAWTQTIGPISLQVWLDGEPLPGQLSIYANAVEMHMSLGRMWVHAQGVPAGPHKLMIVAGMNTITDQNDRVSLTLWQLGDGVAVRASADLPCPSGSGQKLLSERFGLHGGPFLISGAGSGWVTQANGLVQTTMLLDGGDALMAEVFANNAEQHLATVPVDLFYPKPQFRGEMLLQLVAQPATSTDGGDTAHLTALEFVDPSAAPAVIPTSPPLMDTPANSQSGGDYIAETSFESAGGTLLFRLSVSAFSPQPQNLLGVSVQIDGDPVGRIELFANPSETHLALPSNDLVVGGLAAGGHTLYLQADAATSTDYNDRVGVMAFEFPAAGY